MAGTISIAGTQQFKPSGSYAVPLAGGKLYILAAGETNTPQNAYQDVGLTIAHPNPITLDESGFIPPFYVADGFIKYRLVDADGLTIREYDNLQVTGPSSGDGGGGGGGVDPTTIFATGDTMWQDVSGSRTGWVRDNGRTIGSDTSGANERASAGCEALFAFVWNKYSDTLCPVSTGRGANAAADWSANKTIQLLDKRNCVPGGLDDMGNSAAGGFANVPVVTGDTTTAGSVLGESLHQLLKAELPTDKPTGTITNGAITVSPATMNLVTGSTNGQSGGDRSIPTISTNQSVTASQASSTFAGDALGSGTKMNVVQKTALGTWYRKL